MKSRLYKTIFFDWNKTLSYSRFWQQLESPHHPYHETEKAISKFLFSERRELLRPWMRGTKSTDDILNEISTSIGISHDFLKKELKQSCENMSLEPDGILDQIQLLRRKGIQCVIATDNMDTFRDYTIPALKLAELFDDFLISNELGVLKFDVDKEKRRIPFFESYLTKHALGYEDVVLIDDCVDDGFYKEVGFRIMQVRTPKDLTSYIQELLI